jgi:hypothetical protein
MGAQYHLRQMMVFLNGHFINKLEVMIREAPTKFDASGALIDQTARNLIPSSLQSRGMDRTPQGLTPAILPPRDGRRVTGV